MDEYKYGKSVTLIAKLAGMSPAAITRALQGRGTGLVNAKRISSAMGIGLDEFWLRYYADGKSRRDPSSDLSASRRSAAA